MSEKQKSKAKKVVYRKIHKSLEHLMENTKHAFDERLRGPHQRQESEPVYFGVSVMSAQENSTLEIFESATQYNYQEAAKQRTTRTRSNYKKHQGPKNGSRLHIDQSRSPPEQFRQVDCPRRPHRERPTRADCLPAPAQESSKAIQSKGLLDSDAQPALSSHFMVPDATTPHYPTFPGSTPCSMTSPSFAFAGLTEVPTLRRPISPLTAFMKDIGISGLGTGTMMIDQTFASLLPRPAPNDCQETCQDGQFHHYILAGPSTLPLYDLPAEAYNGFNQQNIEFPLTNNCSFGDTSDQYRRDPNFHENWFSG